MNASRSIPANSDEVIPADEAERIDELVAIMRAIQEEKDRRQQPVPREVHPKQHGCVRAELTIDAGLPDNLRQGLFREPRSFAAVIRFSNAKQRDDRLPDGHGMAIKVVGTAGARLLEADRHATTQDFVLVDHPVFFAKDPADLVPLMRDFQRLMTGGLVGKTRAVLKAMFSPDRRYQLLRRMGAKRPRSPLDIQYWSTTPLQWGSGAAKVSVRPQASPPLSGKKSADKLRLALVEQLRSGEARFDFLVQWRTNPATMPLEDATVAWDEAESPYRKVATLRIPPQAFDTAERKAFGENLSFTPWHGLVEHRPLGGINRARRTIYEAMATRRRELNGTMRPEPTPEDVARL